MQLFPIFVRQSCAMRSRKQRRPLHLASEIASRLGIELPFDKDFVTYVSGRRPNELHQLRRLRSESINNQLSTFNFLRQWPALQIIGKDILVPAHGIYWLIMLHAIGFPMIQNAAIVSATVGGISAAQMSKSVGTSWIIGACR